jgi:hypothetical protein
LLAQFGAGKISNKFLIFSFVSKIKYVYICCTFCVYSEYAERSFPCQLGKKKLFKKTEIWPVKIFLQNFVLSNAP